MTNYGSNVRNTYKEHSKKHKAATKAVGDMLSIADSREQENDNHLLKKVPCVKCGFHFEAILNHCEKCGTLRVGI